MSQRGGQRSDHRNSVNRRECTPSAASNRIRYAPEALIIGEATRGEEDEGRAILDGIAAGLPTVSSDCDGVLDIVVEGETGLMVPPRDGAKLAAAVGELLGDAARRERMGQAGRGRVLGRFTEARMADAIEQLYAEALAARGSVAGSRNPTNAV